MKHATLTKSRRTNRGALPGANRRASAELLEARQLLSTYTVNSLLDVASPEPGVVTLRQAVKDADAHAGADTINFSPSLFQSPKTITLKLGQLNLTDKTGATTLSGPGASELTVSGNSSSRIFAVSSGVTATIISMTLAKGVGSVGPDSRYDGGAILNQGTLTLNSCTLTGNTGAPSSGGGRSTRGGAIFSSGTLTVESTVLSNNTALGADVGFTGAGGAIYSTGPVTLVASTLSGNMALGDSPYAGSGMGGAIYDSGKLSVSSSTLSNNSALAGSFLPIGMPMTPGSGSGGAIFSTNSVTLTSSTITGNTAHGATTFYGPNGGAYGGGIWGSGPLVISGCTISNNSITSGDDQVPGNTVNKNADGGGIYSLGSLSLSQSTVSGNSALGGDGQYQFDAGSAARGGGIFVSGALTVSASTISGNHATGGVGDPSNVGPDIHSGPGGNAQGGGVWAGKAATLTNTTIASNLAAGGAGGSDSVGAPSDETHAGNGGNADGGGIYAFTAIKLFDTTLSGNTANPGAGGAGFPGGDGFPSVAAGKKGAFSGGGLFTASSSSLLDNTVVSADKANGAFNDVGGGVQSTSANNLIGVGGGLANGVHGNKVGINNPMLSALGSNGGPTKTMVPLATSPAINAGANSLIPAGVTTDQRGLHRIVAGIVDIGAVEVSASISGEVFGDANGNGKLDSTEHGLAQWIVYLDLNKDGQLDSGDVSTVTNAAGDFTFTNLAPGSYVVRVKPMTGYIPTKPVGGTETITVTVGKASTGNLFGEKKI